MRLERGGVKRSWRQIWLGFWNLYHSFSGSTYHVWAQTTSRRLMDKSPAFSAELDEAANHDDPRFGI
jgi:hypothetical protein